MRDAGKDGRRRAVRSWDGARGLAAPTNLPPPPCDRVVKGAQEAAKQSVRVVKLQNDFGGLEERVGDCETCGRF